MTLAQPGTWRSPITLEMLTESGVTFGYTQTFDGELYWDELRPTENGRNVVVSKTGGDLLPPPWSASTRVHEMGGLSWLVCTWQKVTGVLFAEKTDQRIYWLAPGAQPVAITPESPTGTLARYCDFLIRGSEIWCIREITRGHETSRDLIAISPAGEIRTLDANSHFYAHLVLSPDQNSLAWINWEHPQMPWDGTELRVAKISSDGELETSEARAGSTSEAVNSPVWANNETLFYLSDKSGFWNIWETSGLGSNRQVVSESAEWSKPMWQVGMNLLRILPDGKLVGIHGSPASEKVAVVDPTTGAVTDCKSELSNFSQISVHDNQIFAIGGGAKVPAAIVEFSASTGQGAGTISEVSLLVDVSYFPTVRSVSFPSKAGRTVHAFISEATNPDFESSEKPPVIITAHGGPTANTTGVAAIKRAFVTSRGFTVVDVDYGGSTGYGRDYREVLKGQWGIVDTEDILAVVAGLIESGFADPNQILIRGGSAGGFVVLNGLVHSNVFAAGANYYGVAELTMLTQDTHDFESRYLDSLVGAYPQERELYIERSPLTYADNLTSPLIIFQGADDPIVPPSQSQAFRDACIKNGIKHKYFEFPGESHGFRKSETIMTCAIEELKFYGEVLGFTPDL
jgi:dipeptidyl aminopeptidase/acylaminoacyl peptidase